MASERVRRVQSLRQPSEPAQARGSSVAAPENAALLQPMLAVQRLDDPREQEADRMAAQVDEQLALDDTDAERRRREREQNGTTGAGPTLQRSNDERMHAAGMWSITNLQVQSVPGPAHRTHNQMSPFQAPGVATAHSVVREQSSTTQEASTDADSVEVHQGESPSGHAEAATATAGVRRSVQRAAKATDAPADAGPVVAAGTASGGQPLDATTRSSMERGFNHSFANVRVHADAAADASAAAVQARAYTVGHDIVFRAGQYAPGTPGGRRLLAHELAHTIQQGAAPLLQRQPDGGAPAAPPAAAPPATAPGTASAAPTAPASTPPKPSGTTEEREQVTKALASRDPGDVKAIKNVNAADEDEKLDLIRILTKQSWVGIRDEWKLEEIWRSFGDRLPEVAGKNLLLWQDSIRGGADVMDIPIVQKILIDYMNDIKTLAMSYLDKNKVYVQSERERLGIGVAAPTPEQDKQLKLVQNAAVYVKQAMQQQAQLKKIHVGYSLLGTEKGSTTGQPAIPTWTRKMFDPTEPPQANLDKDEKDKLRDYNKVKTYWDPQQAFIDGVAAQYPAIYSALQNQEESSFWSFTDPLTNTAGPIYGLAASDDPAKARAVIGESLAQTLGLIDGARVKIMSDKPSYRDMTPLNAQLLGGTAPSLFSNRVWREPFNKWVIERDLKEQHDADFYKQLGVNALTAAAFVFLELATAGTATFFIVAAAGSALTGGTALESVEKFTQLSNAARANVSDSTRIVDKAVVTEAQIKALQDVATFLAFVARVGIKAVAGATAQPGGGPAVSPAADARTSGKPADAMWTWAEVESYLQLTEDGRRALETAQRNKIKLEYGAPGESKTYHRRPPAGSRQGGLIVISRQHNSQEATLAFIHEMGHNEYYHSGGASSHQIRSVSRDTFIGTKIMEEAMVNSREIRAKNEMNRFGGFNVDAGGPGAEQAYNRAVGQRMKALRAENANYSEDYLRQQGHIAGENAVFNEYMKGNIRSSVPVEVMENGKLVRKENPSYVDYYGAAWDRANAPPTP